MAYIPITELKGYNRKYIPIACPNCGRRLKKEQYSLGFDTQTGDEIFGTVLFCPKVFGIKSFTHYSISFDENGDEIADRYL